MSLFPKDRPRLELEWTTSERLVALVGFVALLATIVVGVVAYRTLPEQVPVHFDLVGQPDRWGGSATLLFLPLVAFLTWVPLAWLTTRPDLYNYPVKIDSENAERQYRLGRGLMLVLNALSMSLYGGIVWAQWVSANEGRLSPGALLGLILAYTGLTVGLAVGWFVRSRRLG